MGTPAFAIPVLSALLGADHDVAGVYAKPDRPAGRGRRVAAPPVKTAALKAGLPVFQPASLRRDEAARQELASLSPDVIVVAAYGLFLPADTLAVPPLGCLNIHPSLLPRNRGASPVASAILSGERTTGVTIIQLDEGMDTGPILAQRETAIDDEETAGELTKRLFRVGADLVVDTLPRWERGDIQATPQDHSLATVTARLSKEDGRIDWGRSAAYIARQVRAYEPWPGSFTLWRGKRLKIIGALALEVAKRPGPSPGSVVSVPAGGAGIVTAEGVLALRTVQLEGRRALGVRDFVQGHGDFVGASVGA